MVFWRFIKKLFRGLKGKKKTAKRRAKTRKQAKAKKIKTRKSRPKKIRRTVKQKSVKRPKKTKPRKLKKSAKIKAPARLRIKELGEVTHYFDRISVAVLKVKGPLKIGDSIRFASRQGDFVQMVISMQVNRKDILKAHKGSEIGLKTLRPVSVGDKVFMAVEG